MIFCNRLSVDTEGEERKRERGNKRQREGESVREFLCVSTNRILSGTPPNL